MNPYGYASGKCAPLLLFFLLSLLAVPPSGATVQPTDGQSLLPADPFDVLYWSPRHGNDRGRGEIILIKDMPFDRAIRMETVKQGNSVWDVVVGLPLTRTVDKSDVCLISFFARGMRAAGQSTPAQAHVYLERVTRPHEKLVTLPISLGSEWQRIDIPYRAESEHAKGTIRLVLHLGFAPQTVEVGGFSIIDYGTTADPQALPRTRITYEGREPDAPWRQAARERIERFRKGEMSVEVVDSSGNPIPEAAVRMKMVRHSFGFGTAVTAGLLGVDLNDQRTVREFFEDYGGAASIRTYRHTVETLFNKAVFENDMKLGPWQESRTNRHSTYRRQWTDAAMKWLEERRIALRGHWIACGMLDDLPQEILTRPKALVISSVLADMRDKVPVVGRRVVEWDAINHIVGGDETLESLMGTRDVYLELMKEARKLAPGIELWVNEDYILGSSDRLAAYDSIIRYLMDNGLAPDGIGFMGHFDSFDLTPPEEVFRRMDRFAGLIPRLQFTELDVEVGQDEELQADYFRDALTIAFSHPSITGIVIWGFWQGRHWKPQAALFRKDWSIKPAGRVWQDLVFKEWWTDLSGRCDRRGVFSGRGFFGEYEVSAEHDGRRVTEKVTLTGRTQRIRLVL